MADTHKPPALRTKRARDAAKNLAVAYAAFSEAAMKWEDGERSRVLANSLSVWALSLERWQTETGVELRSLPSLRELQVAGREYLDSPAASEPGSK